MKKKNRLKQIITERLYLQNKDKAFGEPIRFIKDEIMDLSKALKCSYRTAYNWYMNKFQPDGENRPKLAEHYGYSEENFYFDK